MKGIPVSEEEAREAEAAMTAFDDLMEEALDEAEEESDAT